MDQKYSLLFGCFLMLIGLTSAYAETEYVRSVKCQLFSEPDYKSAVIQVLSSGTRVNVLKSKGVWLQVSVENAGQPESEGWVSKFLLTKKKMLTEREDLTDLDGINYSAVRRRASAVTTAAGSRGLTTKGKEQVSKVILPGHNFEALKLMESFKPTEEEVEQFIQALRSQ